MKKLFGEGFTFLCGNGLLLVALIPFIELTTKQVLYTGFSTIAFVCNLIILMILMLLGCVFVYFGWEKMVGHDIDEEPK